MNIYTKGGDKGTTSLVHTKKRNPSNRKVPFCRTLTERCAYMSSSLSGARSSARTLSIAE